MEVEGHDEDRVDHREEDALVPVAPAIRHDGGEGGHRKGDGQELEGLEVQGQEPSPGQTREAEEPGEGDDRHARGQEGRDPRPHEKIDRDAPGDERQEDGGSEVGTKAPRLHVLGKRPSVH